MSNSGMGAIARSSPPPLSWAISSSLAALRARFAREESGAVAMTFGVALVPCVMMVGLAIDYGRITLVKQNTQSVLDGAALAGARAWQSAPTASKEAEAENAVRNYWAAVNPAVVPAGGAAELHFKGAVKHAINGQAQLTLTKPIVAPDLHLSVTQWVSTPFLSVSALLPAAPGTNNAPVGAPGDCARSKYACMQIEQKSTVRLLQTGGSDDEKLEISVMLDVTGSMLERPGTNSTQYPQNDATNKLSMMKKAARSFVDIVLPETSSNGATRMALVPFSQDVYLGDTLTAQIAPSSATCTRNVAGCAQFNFQRWDYRDGRWEESTYNRSNVCLVGRSGTNANTDMSPSSSAFLPMYESCATNNSSHAESNKLIPLQNDPAILKTAIDRLYARGGTAGHVGTAWAWYTLSPEWASTWGTASAPKPYTETNVKKVAVLMTDGEYNHQHCKGVQESRSIMTAEGSNTICDMPSSQTTAGDRCAAMKAKGITVYTIAFDVSTSAQNFLKNSCATSEAHAYTANSEASIMAAFQDIALKTSRTVVFK